MEIPIWFVPRTLYDMVHVLHQYFQKYLYKMKLEMVFMKHPNHMLVHKDDALS